MTIAIYIAGLFPSPKNFPIKALMKILGPVLIITFYGLAIFCTYTYFAIVFPWYTDITFIVSATLFGLWLLGNILFNYTLCLITGPGYPEGQTLPMCNKCNKYKPQRAHHCSVCNTCILKMDHHCPWINNCLGLKNHRYFLLFLLYLDLGCLFFTAISYEVFFSIAKSFILATSFSLCLIFWIVILFFGGWHWFLAANGTTTIEYFDKTKAQFSTNSWKKNLEIIFGTRSLLKIILPRISELNLDESYWPETIHSV